MPFDRAHVAAAEQMNLAVERDRGNSAARPRQRRDRRPGICGSVVDEALGVRAAVLLDEAADGVERIVEHGDADVVGALGQRRGVDP